MLGLITKESSERGQLGVEIGVTLELGIETMKELSEGGGLGAEMETQMGMEW